MTAISSPRTRLFQTILILTVMVLSYAVWRQHRALQKLKAGPAAADAIPTAPIIKQPDLAPAPRPTDSAPEAAPEAVPEPAVETPTQPTSPTVVMELTPTGKMAPRARTDGLTLAGTHVVPTEGGLRATMKFTPTVTEPLGIIDIVVRLPRDSEQRILGLDAAGNARFADVAQRVSEDGKFALFHGQLEAGEAVEFALSVSGESVAEVNGSTGIGSFALVIGPGGTSVRKK